MRNDKHSFKYHSLLGPAGRILGAGALAALVAVTAQAAEITAQPGQEASQII